MLFTDRLKMIRFDLNDNRLYWWHGLRSRTGCIVLGIFCVGHFFADLSNSMRSNWTLRGLELICLSLLNIFCQVSTFPIFEQGMLFTDRPKMIRFDLNNPFHWLCWLLPSIGTWERGSLWLLLGHLCLALGSTQTWWLKLFVDVGFFWSCAWVIYLEG